MNRIRRRHRAFLTAAMLLFSVSACFADIRTDLPLLGRDDATRLPFDSRMGQTVQTDSSEQHVFLATALGAGVYDYAWMEAYVLESSRDDVSIMVGQWLSSNLPIGPVLMSAAQGNGDGSVSIDVGVGDDVVCFVIADIENIGFRIVAASIM